MFWDNVSGRHAPPNHVQKKKKSKELEILKNLFSKKNLIAEQFSGKKSNKEKRGEDQDTKSSLLDRCIFTIVCHGNFFFVSVCHMHLFRCLFISDL